MASPFPTVNFSFSCWCSKCIKKLGNYFYGFRCCLPAIIPQAVRAASAPLLPSFPPALSCACSSLRVVITPKMQGFFSVSPICNIPSVAAWHTKSKWGVSPCITHPRQITASQFLLNSNWAPWGNSKEPGTRNTSICTSCKCCCLSAFNAPVSNF